MIDHINKNASNKAISIKHSNHSNKALIKLSDVFSIDKCFMER